MRGLTHLVESDLSETDMDALRLFALRVQENLTLEAVEKLPFVFPREDVPSWKQVLSRVVFLAGIKPVRYDCCVDSCCAFTGSLSDADACWVCKLPRFDGSGRARRRFCYLPLIPRLKAFRANMGWAKRMEYRGKVHSHTNSTISDIFDGDEYRSRIGKHVIIDGKESTHTFFKDDRDIALGFSTDGFSPFQHRRQSTWPLLLFNYNLPPEERFLRGNYLPLGIVPGPNKPRDFDSFLWPMVEELLQLEAGVTAFDAISRDYFTLRAYLIVVFGDIPAMSMLMQMKGHNGFAPCRMCNIHGVAIPCGHKTYYVPLNRSSHPDIRSNSSSIHEYDPRNLPLRSHEEIIRQAREVQSALTNAESDRLAKEYGVKGLSILSHLSSLTFPTSFPFDFMHLIWENLVKNLILLWTGEFKGLDEGVESYRLEAKVWDAVGEACAASGSTIPAAYGARPHNVSTDKNSWTAESRSFWTLYLGPVLLRRRFSRPKYYKHFVNLIKLLNTCLQFEYSTDDVDTIRAGFIKWVMDYEK
jgi:hypothetical protein